MATTYQEVDRIQKGDSGTELWLYVVDEDGDPVPITGATTLTIKIKQPVSGDVDTHTASIQDGPGGIMMYELQGTDTDEAGLCQAQGYCVLADGWTGHTSIETYFVEDNLS